MFPNMDVISHKYYYIKKVYRSSVHLKALIKGTFES